MTAKCYFCETQYPDTLVGATCYECGGRGMVESVQPQACYAIKKIWNDDKHREALDAIVPEGYEIHKRRGRGFRRGQNVMGYSQHLPMDLAAYYTMYIRPKGTKSWNWQQVSFRGFRNGKPVLRCERPNHIAKPH